jgi:predicted lipid-binding transport protein (Tim44 family)
MNQTESTAQNQAASQKPASNLQVFKAVLWGLLGVRQHSGYASDAAKITLKQAVVAGLIGGLIFVGTIASMVILAIKYMQP